jgi:hypothetical protein
MTLDSAPAPDLPASRSRRYWAGRLVFSAALLALLALSTFDARQLYAAYQTQDRLPLWDMAGHGWGGVELLQALARGEPLRFLDRLNRQDKWPFGYSLLLLPFLAAGNASFASATLLSAVLFAAVPPLLLWAAREIDPGPSGLWGGLLAGVAFLAAPLHRLFAILIMRETAGIAFTALALALYLRGHRIGTPWAWRRAGLAALALVLVKVNYGLLWVLAVGAAELLALPAARRRELLRRVAKVLWPWPGAGFARTLLAVYLDVILICGLAGVNFGVGIYAGIVVATVILLRALWRDRAALAARWRDLPEPVRQLAATFVLPLWLWFLSPDPIHPKTIVAFLRNRATGPLLFSAQSFLFYPRAFLDEYAALPAVGGATLLLAALGLVLAFWKGGFGHRLLALLALLGLLLATLHPYKEPRFLATTAPFLTLLAGLGLASCVFALPRPGWLRLTLGHLACAAALWGLVAAAPGEADSDARLDEEVKLYSSGPGFRKPLAFLLRWARGEDGPPPRLALLGTFNELSESLIRWSIVRHQGYGPPEVVESLSRFPAGLPDAAVSERLARWTAEEHPDRILALRLQSSSPRFAGGDFELYNAWQLGAIAALERDPAWQVTRRRVYPQAAVEVLVLDRRAAPARAEKAAAEPSP